MTRGRLIAGSVAVLVLALAGVLAWQFMKAPANSTLSKNKKRQFLLVFANVSGRCKLIAITGERAFRDETITWRLVDACGYGNRPTRLVFTGSNSSYRYPGTHDEPLLEARLDPNSHEAYLTVKLKKFTGAVPRCEPSDPGVPDDTCWAFTYELQIQDPANPNLYTAIADPRLEVDP